MTMKKIAKYWVDKRANQSKSKTTKKEDKDTVKSKD